MKPKVSICIPTYNRSFLLKRAVKSVLSQTYDYFELIISDNNSTDDHWNENFSLQELDKRILLYKNNTNIGWANNLNKCIEYASGELVLFLCDDDELTVNAIEILVDIHSRHPNVGLFSGNGRFIVNKNPANISNTNKLKIYTVGKEALDKVLTNNDFFFSSVMIKRSAINHVGYFLNVASCDWEMWARIGKYYDIGYIDYHLVNFYSHEVTGRDPQIYIREWVKICKIIVSYFDNSEQTTYLEKGMNEVRNGIFSLGIQSISQRKWKNGFLYFYYGYNGANPIIWTLRIITSLPKAIIKSLLYISKTKTKTLI